MNRIHIPTVNARYWTAIALASLFGTNLGDLWAHNSGLDKLVGLIPLALLAAVVFVAEKRDRAPRELYYWLVIAIIRTGATNIADYFKKVISWPIFGGVLAMLMVGTALWSLSRRDDQSGDMPSAGVAYWSAMLTAGVLGTFYGDVASKIVGKPLAALGLLIVLLGVIALWRTFTASRFALYWLVVAAARTFGTSAGDMIADDPTLDIGLALSTVITGAAFLAVLTLWRGSGSDRAAGAAK